MLVRRNVREVRPQLHRECISQPHGICVSARSIVAVASQELHASSRHRFYGFHEGIQARGVFSRVLRAHMRSRTVQQDQEARQCRHQAQEAHGDGARRAHLVPCEARRFRMCWQISSVKPRINPFHPMTAWMGYIFSTWEEEGGGVSRAPRRGRAAEEGERSSAGIGAKPELHRDIYRRRGGGRTYAQRNGSLASYLDQGMLQPLTNPGSKRSSLPPHHTIEEVNPGINLREWRGSPST